MKKHSSKDEAVKKIPGVELLIGMLNHFTPQTEEVKSYFRKHTTDVSFKKGEIIQEAGRICDFIYFIKKGVVRGFIKEGKKDITTWISADNELVTSISSLDLETPAMENIQALEDCELVAISNIHMNKMYDQFPVTNLTGRKLLQQYYRDAEKRAFIARLNSAETKYKFFLAHYSHLANRVQLRFIASYLGITLETLSRVRKKFSTSV